MVTQELISYVTGELNKGKTREQIRTVLLSGGGWKEEDITEVFQMIPGAQKISSAPISTVAPKIIEPQKKETAPQGIDLSNLTKVETVHKDSKIKELLVFVLVFGLIFSGWYFFRNDISKVLSNLRSSIPEISLPNWFEGGEATQPTPIAMEKPIEPIAPIAPKIPKNCGASAAPDRKSPSIYQKDDVLRCIGEAMQQESCDPVDAVLSDSLFPSKFQILKSGETCNFKLSYPEDSTLVDINNIKLAGQYITCPISVIKKMEDKDKSVLFTEANKDLASEYAAQGYFYGTLGVFIENAFDNARIRELGCNGSFVGSMISSYTKSLSKE